MGIAEARIVGRDDEIARQRDLERAGIAMAMDRGDHRHRQLFHHPQRLAMPAARGDRFALGDVAEIMAGRKTFARAAQDDAADRAIVPEIGNMAAKLCEQRDGERVELVGPVERQPRPAIEILALHQISHRSPFAPRIART